MKKSEFLNTMIETVKYDDYKNKEKLLGILRGSEINYKKTRLYTNISGQRYEDVELRVSVPMIKIAKEMKRELENLAKEVYMVSDEYDFGELLIKPRTIRKENEKYTEHDVFFDEIKDTIIQGIRGAKYTIWAAVAWFTDRDIFNELIIKKNEGLDIRIITSNESSNRFLIDDLEKNFKVIKISLKGDELRNRLHDKFCIIDFEFVMHGSYNWSKNAQNNDETLATALDKDFVKKFADEFMRLYRGEE
ncbi:TPA: phospholipase D-like domain-containing protein [Clostridium perfringens]|nr:phospholipase D-like domain-containing protein [Clostridium perfringens]